MQTHFCLQLFLLISTAKKNRYCEIFINLALPKGAIRRLTVLRASIGYRTAADLHIKSNEKEPGVLNYSFLYLVSMLISYFDVLSEGDHLKWCKRVSYLSISLLQKN